MKNIPMGFWERLESQRAKSGLTYQDIATECGVSKSTIQTYFQQTSIPNIIVGCRIAKCLGVTAEWLVEGK